mmetsp:Transcript_19977/g.28108  ORF Transcript_19977/g.28108 Transcript_19977/m.28108 type:complete len:134 (-) Transcript_19977:1400-1801(-)
MSNRYPLMEGPNKYPGVDIAFDIPVRYNMVEGAASPNTSASMIRGKLNVTVVQNPYRNATTLSIERLVQCGHKNIRVESRTSSNFSIRIGPNFSMTNPNVMLPVIIAIPVSAKIFEPSCDENPSPTIKAGSCS